MRITALLISRWLLPLLVFVAVLLAQVFENTDLFEADVIELGDAASNSVLVNDARELSLLHGHYSRAGFYHPGPGILYARALGEWVAVDALGVAQSRIAGQAFGMFVLMALFLASAAYCVGLLFERRAVGAIATAALLLVAVVCYGASFADDWFPYIFSTPFLAFLAALVALRLGRIEALPHVALATVFVVHGHVGFALFAVFGAALATWDVARAYTRSELGRRAFVKEHRWPLGTAIAITLLGALPIVLHTLISWPGEIGKYLTYTGSSATNSVRDAIEAVAFFWTHSTSHESLQYYTEHVFGQGTVAEANVKAAVLIVGLVAVTALTRSAPVRAVGVVALGTTGLVFFYSFALIDNLGDNYPILWYSAAPTLLIAVVVGSWADSMTRERWVYALALAAMVLTLVLWPKPYAMTTVPRSAVSEAVDSLADGEQPILIVADPSVAGHRRSWPLVAGLLAMTAREQPGLALCVWEGTWVLPYHERYRCAEPLANYRRAIYVGLPEEAPPDAELFATLTNGIVAADLPRDALWLRAGDQLDFSHDGRSDLYTVGPGWYRPETWGRWPDGGARPAELVLPIDQSTAPVSRLVIRAQAFNPAAHPRQRLTIESGGEALLEAHFERDDALGYRELEVDLGPVLHDDELQLVRLRFVAPDSESPAHLGLGDDQRLLGVGISRISIH